MLILMVMVFVLLNADIMPRGYSRCTHVNCERNKRKVVRNKYSNHPFREWWCQNSNDDSDDDSTSLSDSVFVAVNTKLATSEAINIANFVATSPPLNVTPVFIPKDGPISRKVRRARELEMKRLRTLKNKN